jgi:hypothetical protein
MKPIRCSREIPRFYALAIKIIYTVFRCILMKHLRRKRRVRTCNNSLVIVIKHTDFNWPSRCSLTL